MPTFSDVVHRKSPTEPPRMTEPAARPPAPRPLPAPAPAPTFSELQRQGRARPAPPSPTQASPFTGQAGFAPGMNPFARQPAGDIGAAVQNSIFGLLQNPSRYDADAVGRSYDLLSRRIDDDFDLRRQRATEDSARRGLSESSIHAGRLNDLNIGQRDARTQLADSLLDRQAQTFSSDLQNAIATALGYGQQNFGQQLATAQFNQGQDQYWNQLLMALLGAGAIGG